MRRLISLACAATLAASGAAAARDLWHPEGPSILTPDQAFALMPAELAGKAVRVQWNIAPGYYLYRARIDITPLDPAAARVTALTLPAGEKIHDEHFGESEIYRGGGEPLAAQVASDRPLRKLTVRYQGCAELGVCLPPQTRVIDVPAAP